ncbi:MAG: hypothetical protein M1819_007300 [Sarea resinae]|nr:MAG: hypothetical protein M1819_007300 [Sarea resinae]
MPVDEAPDDDATRQSYNVAPGYYELVYRADVPDHGAGTQHSNGEGGDGEDAGEAGPEDATAAVMKEDEPEKVRYKLQAMKWGLIPFWTKRNPDYGSMMRTINCRDDSLLENRGMWTTMKHKKRCVVVCEGFYEWLKKNGGKEKIPHFVRRKDGQLMCFAGLWDCAKFEGSDEKLYTYTIITTSSSPSLQFLHDRMPVILDAGSADLFTWLSPRLTTWTPQLQSLLKPYRGDLDVYPVTKDVGKVGNNSPSFIVPINSAENKANIANFFAHAKGAASGKGQKAAIKKEEDDVRPQGVKIEHEPGEKRETRDVQGTEDNAPQPSTPPAPSSPPSASCGVKSEEPDRPHSPPPPPPPPPPPLPASQGIKREHSSDSISSPPPPDEKPPRPPKSQKTTTTSTTTTLETPPSPPSKTPSAAAKRKTRSSTTNHTSPQKKPHTNNDGSQKITDFFRA